MIIFLTIMTSLAMYLTSVLYFLPHLSSGKKILTLQYNNVKSNIVREQCPGIHTPPSSCMSLLATCRAVPSSSGAGGRCRRGVVAVATGAAVAPAGGSPVLCELWELRELCQL